MAIHKAQAQAHHHLRHAQVGMDSVLVVARGTMLGLKPGELGDAAAVGTLIGVALAALLIVIDLLYRWLVS